MSSVNNPARPLMMNRRPNRPAPGPTTGSMLKRSNMLNRPGKASGSWPSKASGSQPDGPARSGFENVV
ncbi:hypothetical protein Hanom_Chr05g00424451 [Helianthus anomalus]